MVDPWIERAADALDDGALIAFLQQLVQTPSVYNADQPAANEERCALLVYQLLCDWGWQPTLQVVAPGRPNVIADLDGPGGAGRCLLFAGHTDVVTPGDPACWSRDPFSGAIVDGRLYGRGSADMKGGLAAMLFAARAIQRSGVPFRGRIRLAIPVDEEGMMSGIKALVQAGYADDVAAAIICEPEEREVCIAQKGALRLRLLTHGRIAHGAMPTAGVNALAGMVCWLHRLLDLQTRLQQRLGRHPLLGDLYITPTVLQAPASGACGQVNCLPDQCVAYLDIRSLPAISHEQLITLIEQEGATVAGATPGLQCTLGIVDDRPATETDPTEPVVQAVIAAHRRVYGGEPVFGGVPGSTDGTILWRERAIPVVVYGPGDKRIPHQPGL